MTVADQIASIFPLELRQPDRSRDAAGKSALCTSDGDFEPLDFSEIEFQDCSAFIHFDAICDIVNAHAADTATRASANGGQGASSNAAGPIAEPKRKQRADESHDFDHHSKRHRLDDSSLLHMASTACRFIVLARSASTAEQGRFLARVAESEGSILLLSTSDISHLRHVGRARSEGELDLIHSAVDVCGTDGQTLVSLPIINSDAVDFAKQPHRFTNGVWLESALALSQAVSGKRHQARSPIVTVEPTLKLIKRPKHTQFDAFVEAFTIELSLDVRLDLDLVSHGSFALTAHEAGHVHRLVRFAFCDDAEEKAIRSSQALSASGVYAAMHASEIPPLHSLQPRQLNAAMFPFQRSSVGFLLGREGIAPPGKNEAGDIQLNHLSGGMMAHDGVRDVGLWWKRLGQHLFFSPFLGKFTTKTEETWSSDVRGGMLAEEMGLGKTVEVFALVLLNADEARSALPTYEDESLEVTVAPTKTTLIVAPEVLRQQWLDEATLHAPDLRTFSYKGYKDAQKQIPQGKSWTDFARQFDIIVVSYDVLRKEVNVARKAPNRSMRHERKYERPRCLLIQLAFHRVVMDEVQLVGHSSAAETVSMIPRDYSLAVSGTPIKQLSDLRSLFAFLRVPGPLYNEANWSRLQLPEMLPSLRDVLGILATRHTKAQVQAEMTLPQQTRTLVPVDFTAIESAFYRDIYQQCRHAIGADALSDSSRARILTAMRDRFGEDTSFLRNILLALRQACTHPQIAGRGTRGNALATSQNIRSMDEVLTIMIEGTKAECASASHSLVQKRIDRAVLLLQDKTNDDRQDLALAMLQAIQPDIESHITAIKADYELSKRVGPLYRFSKTEFEGENDRQLYAASLDDAQQQQPIKHAIDDNQPRSQAEREREHEQAEKRVHRYRHMNVVHARYRVFLEQMHRCLHFQGNVYFQMGDKLKRTERESEAPRRPDEDVNGSQQITEAPNGTLSKEEGALFTQSRTGQDAQSSPSNYETAQEGRLKKLENEAYNEAEKVRQQLLKWSRTTVEHGIQHVERNALDVTLEQLAPQSDFGNGGLRTKAQFNMLSNLRKKLADHSRVVFEWRDAIFVRLSKAVSRDVSDEDENDDQYQENLDAQAESEALLEMYRVLIAEREFMLFGTRIEGSLGRPQLYAQLVREVPHHEGLQRRLMLWQAQGAELSSRPLAKDDYLPSEQELGVMRQQLDHFRKLEAEKRGVAISKESQQKDSRAAEREARGRARRGGHDESGGAAISAVEDVDISEELFLELKPFENVQRELREIAQSVDGREEAMIARQGMEQIRQLLHAQRSMLEKLKRESAAYSALWNHRAAYFKQMQELSDQVGDIQTADVHKERASIDRDELTLRQRAEASSGRLRYLHAIEEEDSSGDSIGASDVSKACPICTERLIKAVVLDVCGHTTCTNCFDKWTARRRQCPICKANVNLRNIYRVTYGSAGKAKRRVEQPSALRRRLQHERFNVMGKELQHEITLRDIQSALGSKLDFLMRHISHIQATQPGTKSLVFTAFSRGISLVGDALRLNGIRFVTLDTGGLRGGRAVDTFKNDLDVNVLLLHSEAQSSGLNLVCAQNIFLLEPLVNHSIELQAIGRVHRIGQTKPTFVYCYQVNDTVEERVVNLARTRSQCLFTSDKCVSNDLRDSAEMVARTQDGRTRTASREGEFVASMSELVECLVDVDEEDHQEGKGVGANGSHSAMTDNGEVAQLPSSSDTHQPPTIPKNEEQQDTEAERARARAERLRAIESRQAMASIERERARNGSDNGSRQSRD